MHMHVCIHMLMYVCMYLRTPGQDCHHTTLWQLCGFCNCVFILWNHPPPILAHILVGSLSTSILYKCLNTIQYNTIQYPLPEDCPVSCFLQVNGAGSASE